MLIAYILRGDQRIAMFEMNMSGRMAKINEAMNNYSVPITKRQRNDFLQKYFFG